MQPGGKEPLRELALFAGAGGGILGGHLLGWRCVCAVEIEDYPRRVLLARQRDGMLPRFPIWDDVTTFDGHPWRGRVDVISGGFPCQDISAAGKGAGITGARSGLWSHMARIIGEVRPRYCFVENSPLLVSRGLDVVLDSFAALGYDAAWGIVGAHHTKAPHKRDRIWIRAELANAGQRRHRYPQEEVCPRWDALEYGCDGVADTRFGRCYRSSEWEDEQPGRAEAECAGEVVAHANGIREPQQKGAFEEQRGRTIDGGEAMANTSGEGCERRKQPRTLRNSRGGAQTHGPVSECSCSPRSEVSDTQGGGFAVCRGASGEGRYALRDGVPTEGGEELSDPNQGGCNGWSGAVRESDGWRQSAHGYWWQFEPHMGGMAHGLASGLDIHGAAAAGDVGRVATGVPNRVGRLKAIGNGQVPAVAALAWRVLE